MSAIATYESLIAQQIKALRELRDRELEKRQALADANLDLFGKVQDLCDAVFERIMKLDAKLSAMTDRLERDSLSAEQRDRLGKLNQIRQDAVDQANAENQINQKILTELLDEMGRHIQHVRKGQKAIAGYGRGLKLGKPPSIISGDV
ncbi:MAG: hypothetical protein P9L99_14365 [Candidatus Lernaella stagnicola]|nr:hypothetical protein [Candidatus Lernaella stagnicola]